jgi:signal transduction histidine kinase
MYNNNSRARQKQFPSGFFIVFLVLACVIGAAGYYFYHSQKNHIRQNQYKELSAIADLKVSQIAVWLEERKADAEFLFRSPIFILYTEQFFLNPNSANLRDNIAGQLSAWKKHPDYANIYLLDAERNVKFAVRNSNIFLRADTLSLAAEALKKRKIILSDIRRSESSDDIHIDLVVPLISGSRASPHAVGVVIIQIDPVRYLFSRIQAWPTPSPSGETLLVRREGDVIVYLNDLRHKKNTALNLKLPLADPNLPAAMAVRGQTGIVEGIDYRGIPVISALRPVPGTSWFLIAKVDTEEVYAPIRERALYIILFVVTLIVAAGLAVGFMQRKERESYYRTLYEIEAARLREHEQADALVRAGEERYRYLFDNMLEGYAYCWMIYINDVPHDFIYLNVNKAFETLTGLKDVVGKKISEAVPAIQVTDPGLLEIYGRVAKTGKPERFEMYVQALRMWFSISVYCPEPECFVAVFDVITERKRAEGEMKTLLEELKRSNAELEQFAYIASHDLQEPLRMVASYLQLLERRYKGKLDSNADEFIGYAVDGAVRMQRMVNDLLTYSRIGTKGKPFATVDCNVILVDVLTDLKVPIKETSARITIDPLPLVTADGIQLAQVFQNLIGNAMKFRGDRTPEIHIHAEQSEQAWRFSVRDNGIGLAPEYYERIFILFKRLHSAARFPGSGIGLTICKKIIERHNGRIWVESEPGRGSVFYFTVPLKSETDGQLYPKKGDT